MKKTIYCVAIASVFSCWGGPSQPRRRPGALFWLPEIVGPPLLSAMAMAKSNCSV
jgi:hypothetical protein